MSNGYAKPNYTQLPNVLLDVHLPNMNGSELKVVLAIARATFGWHKSSAKLSLVQLMEKTGLARQPTLDGIQHGLDRGVITREPDGKGYVYSLTVDDDETVLKQDQSANKTGLESRPITVLKADQDGLESRPITVLKADRHTGGTKERKETTTKKRKKVLVDPDTRASEVAAHAAPPTSDTGWPEFLSAFTKACYQHDDFGLFTKPQIGHITSEAKKIRDKGYTIEDLRLWWQKCWATDSNFKWRKHQERPTPVDIRTGIAALDAIKAEMTMLHEAMDIPRPVPERALPLTPERALWNQITTDYAQLNDAELTVDGDRWIITTIMADWCRVQLTRRIERDLRLAGIAATVEFAMKEQVTP